MYNIKRLMVRSLLATLSVMPLYVLKKLSRTNLVLPFYHMVSDEDVPHVKHLYTFRNTKEFKDDIDYFLRHYSPVSLSDLLDCINKNQSLHENSFLLTFDDGFREIYDVVVPILKEKGVPATFFLNSNFLDNKQLFFRHKASILIEHLQSVGELSSTDKIKDIFLKNRIEFTDLEASILSVEYHKRNVIDEIALILNVDFDNYLASFKPYLNSNQVEKLIEDGFTIGAHSIDHPLYSSLSLEDQLYQTRESVKLIIERFSLDYNAFAFPFTDNGVSRRYFDEILRSGSVDISFGNSGIVKDLCPNNLQRISMEGSILPAKKIIAIQYANYIYGILTGRDEIRRS